MAGHDPGLEVAAHGFRVGRKRRIDAAGAAQQGDERRKFAGRLPSPVVVEQRVGAPDPQRREYRLVLLQLVEQGANHGVGHLPAPVRLGVEDGQRLDRIAVGFQILPEPLRHGARVVVRVALPFGAQHGVQAVVIDRLFLGAANRVEQLDQLAGEHPRRAGGEQAARLVQRLGRRLVIAVDGAVDFAGLGFDAVRIDGRQQTAGDGGQIDAAGVFPDALPFGLVELPVEPGQAPGEGADRLIVAGAQHEPHGEVLERDAGLADERPAGGLQRGGHADRVHDHVVGLGGGGGGGHLPEIVMVEGAGAAPLHLLEVDAASYVAHEDEAFERLHVGAGGDHVHRDGDARIVVVAELGQHRLGVFLGAVGDLLAELVALAELLAHGLNDVVGVAVALGEDQRLGDFAAARKDLLLPVAEGADHGADLIRVHDRAVELLGAVEVVVVLEQPSLPARQEIALLDLPAGGDPAAALRPFGVDDVDFVADVDAVGDGLLVGILADDVLPEEAVGAVVGGGGEADERGVEVLQHLPPHVVDRAVALVDEDEVEELRRNRGVVYHRQRRLARRQLSRVDLLGRRVHPLALEQRIQALDGADAHVAVRGGEGGGEALDVVELGEVAVVVGGNVGHELLFGLLAEVPGVDQKQDAPGVGVLEQAVDRGDGGVGLAGAGGHPDQRARMVGLERCFEAGDGIELAGAQSRGAKRRQSPEPRAQRRRLREPFLLGLRPMEAEHLPRTGSRIAPVGEAGERSGALVDERARLGAVQPLEAGVGIAGGLLLDHGDLPAPLLRLGFDYPDRLAVDEQQVVGGADVGLILPHRYTGAGVEVDRVLRLDAPAGLLQLRVDGVARELLGGAVPVSHQGRVRRWRRRRRPGPGAKARPRRRRVPGTSPLRYGAGSPGSCARRRGTVRCRRR